MAKKVDANKVIEIGGYKIPLSQVADQPEVWFYKMTSFDQGYFLGDCKKALGDIIPKLGDAASGVTVSDVINKISNSLSTIPELSELTSASDVAITSFVENLELKSRCFGIGIKFSKEVKIGSVSIDGIGINVELDPVKSNVAADV